MKKFCFTCARLCCLVMLVIWTPSFTSSWSRQWKIPYKFDIPFPDHFLSHSLGPISQIPGERKKFNRIFLKLTFAEVLQQNYFPQVELVKWQMNLTIFQPFPSLDCPALARCWSSSFPAPLKLSQVLSQELLPPGGWSSTGGATWDRRKPGQGRGCRRQALKGTRGYSTTRFSNHYSYPTRKFLLLERVVE